MHRHCSPSYLEFSENVFCLISYRCRTKLKCFCINCTHWPTSVVPSKDLSSHTHTQNFYKFSHSPSKLAGSPCSKDRESLTGKKFRSIFSGFSNCISYIFLIFNLLLSGYLNLVYGCDILFMLPSSSLGRELKKKRYTHTCTEVSDLFQ